MNKKIYVKVSMFFLYRKIFENFLEKKCFILFRKPFERRLFFYSENRYGSLENLFIIRDFCKKETIKLTPKKIYYIDLDDLKKKKFFFVSKMKKNFFPKINKDDNYRNLVKLTISFIKKKFFKKVVLSKKYKIFLKKNFSKKFLKKIFEKLIFSHPNAFINLWFNNNQEFWIGYTPELLLKYYKNKLETTSLAGTIWNNRKWKKKEIEEHKIVTDYIKNVLKYYKGNLYIDNLKTLKIGRLKHLETKIYFDFFDSPNIYRLINHLYPTPSICGFPIKESFNFINQYEKRSFYTGFMGIMNYNYIELYINIRCAKIKKNNITIYAGSGITDKSNVFQENIEVNKKINDIFYELHLDQFFSFYKMV